jgi:HK97 family phage major capsid protein
MELNELKGAFDAHHNEITAALAAERKAREELEMRMNHLSLGGFFNAGGGNSDEVALKEIGEAFRKFIRNEDKSGFSDLASKGMMVGSDPAGGYAVIPAFSNQITATLKEISPLRSLANVRQISTDSLEEIIDKDDAEAGWVGETASRPNTSAPDLAKWRITPNELYAMPKASQQLLDDAAIDIGAWLVGKVSTIFAQKEGNAFVNGDGVGKPRGFLSYTTAATADATRAWGVLEHVVTGNASGFKADTDMPIDALIDLQSKLKSGYRRNATWIMNRKTAATVAKFKDADKNLMWQRSIALGQPDTLLGHPVILDEEMPDLAANAYPVAFGDFRAGYTIVDRLGTRVMRDPYTSRPYVNFYCYKRVSGDVVNFEAIKLLKCST